MDSIENRPLTDTATQEAVEVATATEVAANSILSKEDVIARLQEINLQEEPADKAELDTLKQTFYRLPFLQENHHFSNHILDILKGFSAANIMQENADVKYFMRNPLY